MHGTVHIFDFLEQDSQEIPLGLCVIFGSDRFLKRLALAHLISGRRVENSDEFLEEEDDFGATFIESEQPNWLDVHDELVSRSLFAPSGPKYVVLDHADKFVRDHREQLENYLIPPKPKTSTKKNAPPPKSADSILDFAGLLILLVDTWASNTRLYKSTDQIGLQIKCDPPLLGKSKSVDTKKINQWLVQRARAIHQFKLSSEGAELVCQLTDFDFGRMDQELQKLALYTDKQTALKPDQVQQIVGGWQTKTTWEAIDAAADGEPDRALNLLDQLLKNGEHPLALFGQIAWSLRRYSQATEIVLRQLRQGKKPDIPTALKNASFPHWGGEQAAYEQRLKRIGSQRASQISHWLLKADMALKRSHSKEDAGRLVLETLLMKIALNAPPKRSAAGQSSN